MEKKRHPGDGVTVPGRITVNGEGGFKYLPKRWGPMESDPEWRAMLAARSLPIPTLDEYMQWHEENPGQVHARLKALYEKWLREDATFLAGLNETERRRQEEDLASQIEGVRGAVLSNEKKMFDGQVGPAEAVGAAGLLRLQRCPLMLKYALNS